MSLPQPSQWFAWTQEPWGAALRCVPLADIAPHLFTSRAVSVSRNPADPALAAVAASLGLPAAHVLQVHQVHGRDVIVHPQTGSDPEADGLMTGDSGRAVAVRVADCAALLMADRRRPVVAAVHAGWRGTAAAVADAAVDALRAQFGADPRDLLVAIGPSIRRCCYEVGPEVRVRFEESGHDRRRLDRWFARGSGDRWMLDVPGANRDQLEAAGVPPGQIFDSGLCTGCHAEVFHSYRRSGGRAGRNVGVIKNKKQKIKNKK